MTPERSAELAKQLGLESTPKIRYEEAPDENPNLDHVVNFKKAVMLVDSLRTAKFARYIPERCVIDQEMDASSHSEGMSDATLIRTDVPPPVDPRNPTNRKISHATGIPFRMDDEAYMIWLGGVLETMWLSYGARRMAPPLIFAGGGGSKRKRVPGAKPFIGLIVKFSRKDTDRPADWGAIVPPGTRVNPENRRMPVAEFDNRRRMSLKTGEGKHG